MALWEGIKRQLRSVIEWKNPHENELFYRWSSNGDEIKNASTLILQPGQGCIFIYEGKIVSIIEDEGSVSLLTENIPFWTTVTKIMQAFESEHKVALYFYKKTKVLDQKWGTKSSIKYNDPVYNFPVALQAFGNYSIKVNDPALFFTQVVGGAELYMVSDLREVMINRLTHPLTDYLAEQKFSYADIDANRNEISNDLMRILKEEFKKLGFTLLDFRIEGSDFDKDTVSRINKIANVNADIYAAKTAGISYTELQKLDALKNAASNEVGAAGMFMGVGAGSTLSQSMNESSENNNVSIESRLEKLKSLHSKKLISDIEYTEKKSAILKEL